MSHFSGGSSDDDDTTDSDVLSQELPCSDGRRAAQTDSGLTSNEDDSDDSDDELDKFMSDMAQTASHLEEKFARQDTTSHQRNCLIDSNSKLHQPKQKQRRPIFSEIDPINQQFANINISGATRLRESGHRGSQSFTNHQYMDNSTSSGKYARPSTVGIGGEKNRQKRTNIKADLVASKLMADDNFKSVDIWDFLKCKKPVLPPIAIDGNLFQDTGNGDLPGVDV